MMAQFTLAQSYKDACEEEKADEFRKKLAAVTGSGHLCLAIALGIELKLFDALAKAGSATEPATALDVAREAGLRTRYCFEWLCCMACGGIIEVDESGQQFWIPEERLSSLLTGPERDLFFVYSTMVPMLAGSFRHVSSCFHEHGPMGIDYSHYRDFYSKMSTFSEAMHKKHLIKDFIPLIHMYTPLSMGIQVLDVGCGAGFHVLEIAEHFPKSHFVGIDIGAEAIRTAQHRAAERNLTNVEFICANASAMDAQWTELFDLILIFDACHDQCRPDLAMKEIHRCLKADGLFAMLEINGTGNCHEDRHRLGAESATMLYAASLFHCLPVGSNSEDALQLGTMWGVEMGRNMLDQTGFTHVTVEEVPFYHLNVLYRARKQ